MSKGTMSKAMTSKLLTMRSAIAEFVPDGASVALGLQMEQMIPFAAGHEIMRQRRRGLTLIGPISDILFDQLIGAQWDGEPCVARVIAAWVGNVMMGSAYNFCRAVEEDGLSVVNMTNFTMALALQAGAMGVPFLPTLTAMGSDVVRNNHFFRPILSPFAETERKLGAVRKPSAVDANPGAPSPDLMQQLLAVRALNPDVAIVHVQRADRDGNAHCWGNFGVMLEGVGAARRVIVAAEEIVEPEVIASDPNRTAIPGFLVSAVVHEPFGAHPSPVQGYYKRDDAAFRQYHEQSKTKQDFENWAARWVYEVSDRRAYMNRLGACRVGELGVKRHAYAAATDFGY